MPPRKGKFRGTPRDWLFAAGCRNRWPIAALDSCRTQPPSPLPPSVRQQMAPVLRRWKRGTGASFYCDKRTSAPGNNGAPRRCRSCRWPLRARFSFQLAWATAMLARSRPD